MARLKATDARLVNVKGVADANKRIQFAFGARVCTVQCNGVGTSTDAYSEKGQTVAGALEQSHNMINDGHHVHCNGRKQKRERERERERENKDASHKKSESRVNKSVASPLDA